jgi:hypothetical protein
MESQEVQQTGIATENKEIQEIPLIVHKGNASFLSERFTSVSNDIGISHDTNTPYKVLIADNGDVIFRPWVNPDLIYHYCSPDAFKSILSSKTLRMTDARFCNDATEQTEFLFLLQDLITKSSQMEITDDILDRQVSQILARKEITEDEKKVFVQNIENFKSLSPEARSTQYQTDLLSLCKALYDDLKNSISSNNPRYISCFCEQGDIKSQWMEYADKGKGFSIGFNFQLLNKASNIYLKEVLYHKNRQFELLNWAILQYGFDPKSIHRWINEVMPVIKNQAFHEEREWRIIHTPSTNSDELTLKPGMMGIGKIYYEFTFKPEFISEIILGPQCEVTVQECITFLRYCGIKLNENQVRKSVVPIGNSKNK